MVKSGLLKQYFNKLDSANQLKFKEDEFSFDDNPKAREKFLGELEKRNSQFDDI